MMPGEEIVPVTKAAASAGRSVFGESKETKSQLTELAKDSPAMKAAAEKYARRVAIKQGILLRIYEPLAKWAGASEEYFKDEFASDMAEKVADIPDENLTAPSASVAVPAIQGLSYSLEEPNLKEMYLHLLATATDGRRSDQAHPSFAEIIKQLSPEEAHLLRATLARRVLAIVQLRRRAETGTGGTLWANHVMGLVDSETDEVSEEPSLAVWVDNWLRLGLVEVDYTSNLVAEEAYVWVDSRPEMQRLIEADGRGADAAEVRKGILRATDFGLRFGAAVAVIDGQS